MISAHTNVYCVIGNPVSHSLSPIMHNAAFEKIGYDGVYLAFEVEDVSAAVGGIRSLGIRGVSVTIPHKVSVISYLDEVDTTAQKIGAVNTIINRNGKLKGYNTDFQGAVKALAEKTEIRGKRVLVLGAGGAARAIGFGIHLEGGRLTLSNRSREKGERLAEDLQASFCGSDEIERNSWDIIINTTSVGMTPDTGQMPVPEAVLSPGQVVMDIVYTPLDTLLLKTARKKGCVTVDGAAMFVYQGVCQFELWTAQSAPVSVMDQAVREVLEKRKQVR